MAKKFETLKNYYFIAMEQLAGSMLIERKWSSLQNVCGLYYKHITIVNYDSSIFNKFGALLTDDARGVIYDRQMFIVQATE